MEKKEVKKTKPILAANWKENKNNNDISAFLNVFMEDLSKLTRSNEEGGAGIDKEKLPEIVIAPSFIGLSFINTHIGLLNRDRGFDIKVAAQNMDYHESGAYTGEVSAKMLKDHVSYVILGHSERRRYYMESNEIVNKKVLHALNNDMQIILCIGENAHEREAGKQKEVLKEQLEKGLLGVSKNEIHRIVIAYEPVWAIGTGITPEPKNVNELHGYIKDVIMEMLNLEEKHRKSVFVLYGGSVKMTNVESFVSKPEIDGALVGGASLDPAAFFGMAQILAK